MTKEEEERSPPRSLFDHNGNECGDTTWWTEDRIVGKEDSGGPWQRPETEDWDKDVKRRWTERQHAASGMLHEGQYSTSCLVCA